MECWIGGFLASVAAPGLRLVSWCIGQDSDMAVRIRAATANTRFTQASCFQNSESDLISNEHNIPWSYLTVSMCCTCFPSPSVTSISSMLRDRCSFPYAWSESKPLQDRAKLPELHCRHQCTAEDTTSPQQPALFQTPPEARTLYPDDYLCEGQAHTRKTSIC